MAELDLAGVPPTSHPLDLVNVWDDDVPRPWLQPRRGTCNAPARESNQGAAVSRPRGLGVIDTLRLTAEDALGVVERREVSSPAAYVAAAGERDTELHAYLRLVEFQARCADRPQGRDLHQRGTRRPQARRSSPVTSRSSTRRLRRCKEAGLPLIGKTNTDESAMGSSTDSAYGRSRNRGIRAECPADRAEGRRPRSRAGSPRGASGQHRRLDQAAFGTLRQRRAAADLRHRVAVRNRRVRIDLDQIGPVAKTVRDVARLYSIIAGRDVNDSTTVELPEAVELPTAKSVAGLRIGSRSKYWDLPDRAGGSGVVRGCDRDGTPSAPRSAIATCHSRSTTGWPATTSLRPPRRRRTSRATTGCATAHASRRRPIGRWSSGRVTRMRRRAQAPHHARHLRALGRLLRRVLRQAQRVRTLLIREHQEALQSFDVIATPTSPTVAFPIGDKAADPLAMYACDVMTIPSCLAGLPGLNVPSGLSRGCPSACS